MIPDPSLPQDFVDLLAEFAEAEVRYLVVGGYAVGFHDRPRATKDLDVLIADTPENVVRACQALAAFGAPPAVVEALRQAGHDEVVWFGVPPTRIDVLKSTGGVNFEEAYERRVRMQTGSVEVTLVGLADLIAMKRAADRDQDRVDVKRLERRLRTRQTP